MKIPTILAAANIPVREMPTIAARIFRGLLPALIIAALPFSVQAQELPLYDGPNGRGLEDDHVLVDALYDVATRVASLCFSGESQACDDLYLSSDWLVRFETLGNGCAGGDTATCDEYRQSRVIFLTAHVEFLSRSAPYNMPLDSLVPEVRAVTIAQIAALSELFGGSDSFMNECFDPSPECEERHDTVMEMLRQ